MVGPVLAETEAGLCRASRRHIPPGQPPPLPFAVASKACAVQMLEVAFSRLDVLLAGLQRHAVAQLAVFVFRPADDASRHIALVLVAGGKVGCRRPP